MTTRPSVRPGRGHLPRAAKEGGSASVWILVAALLALFVGSVVVLRSAAVLARHRAEAAADLAALAAAARIGTGLDACSAAGPIAAANGAVLTSCTTRLAADGRSGTVSVQVRLHFHLAPLGVADADARARAARLPGGRPAAIDPKPASRPRGGSS